MEEIKIQDGFNISCRFHWLTQKKKRILILRAIGCFGKGSGGKPDGLYLPSMMAAACFRWSFNAAIFDFIGLEYEMSDDLRHTFDTLGRLRSPNFERYVIVSEKNRASIESLMTLSSQRHPIPLVGSFEEILEKV